MKKKKPDLITVKILRKDAKKAKIWSIQRNMKFYELISLMINK